MPDWCCPFLVAYDSAVSVLASVQQPAGIWGPDRVGQRPSNVFEAFIGASQSDPLSETEPVGSRQDAEELRSNLSALRGDALRLLQAWFQFGLPHELELFQGDAGRASLLVCAWCRRTPAKISSSWMQTSDCTSWA